MKIKSAHKGFTKKSGRKWVKLIKDPHVADQYTGLLGVERAHPYDEGIFTCQVEDFNMKECLSKEVLIEKKPSIKIEPVNLTVKKGENFTIKCVTTEESRDGSKYIYSWTKNKELLPVRTEFEKYEVLYPSGTILQVKSAEEIRAAFELVNEHLSLVGSSLVSPNNNLFRISMNTIDLTILNLTYYHSNKYFHIPNNFDKPMTQWLGVQISGTNILVKEKNSRLAAGIIFRNISNFMPPRLFIRIKDGSELEYEIYSQIVTLLPLPEFFEMYPIAIDFKHQLNHKMNWSDDETWSVKCGYADLSTFTYSWNIYSCYTEVLSDLKTRCICPKHGIFALLLTLAPKTKTEETTSNVFFLILASIAGMVLTVITTVCLSISCFLKPKSTLTMLKLQCSFSMFLFVMIFLIAVVIGPTQSYYLLFLTGLETTILLSLSSHLSKLLIIFTELTELPKSMTSKHTVTGIISVITRQDPEVENDSTPHMKPEQFTMVNRDSTKPSIVGKSQSIAATFESCLHNMPNCDSRLDVAATSQRYKQQASLEYYNSSPQSFRKYSGATTICSPDILANKVCVELDLVASSLQRQPSRSSKVSSTAPSISPDEAIAKILDYSKDTPLSLPPAEGSYKERTQPDGHDESIICEKALSTVEEVSETEMDSPEVSEKPSPVNSENKIVVQSSANVCDAIKSDNLDGMLDSISQDLDYLLNKSDEVAISTLKRVSKSHTSTIDTSELPESVTIRSKC
ncbi:unnamed protein product [Diabrotica balteata]|uniref:Ig-like domain-containing protein n=1 Tax=Diabrotica balteata TaxID=107213 RepID=A0A9N9XD01_DIABA|nr:unnamed protein product [Diabrotica balteata]